MSLKKRGQIEKKHIIVTSILILIIVSILIFRFIPTKKEISETTLDVKKSRRKI